MMALVLVPWALGCFSAQSTQQARLGVAAPALAPALMALNTSAIYLGQAAGAASGGWLLARQRLRAPQLGRRWPGWWLAIALSQWADAGARTGEGAGMSVGARSDEPRRARAARPRSTTELFFAFNWLALQGFGGVLRGGAARAGRAHALADARSSSSRCCRCQPGAARARTSSTWR